MIFQSKTLQVKEIEGGILELQFCSPQSVNTLDTATLGYLDEALDVIQKVPDLKGLILTSDKESFIVGADINEFLGLFQYPSEELEQWLHYANRIFCKLEDLPVPTISALCGYALGGGCECVLATDFRIATPSTKIGLPETRLGIMPGFGGCVRLPRLIGADNALEAIVQAKILNAEQALSVGLVDAISTEENLLETAKQTLDDAIHLRINWKKIRQEKCAPLTLSSVEQLMVFSTAKGMTHQKVSTHYMAPFLAIETIEASAMLHRDEALNIERKNFVTLAKSDQATALVSIYLNDQYIKGLAKKAKKSLTHPMNHSAVIGAGVMGGGIAYQSAIKGIPAVLKDIVPESLKLGMDHTAQLLEQGVKRGKLSPREMANTLSSIRPTLNYAGIEDVDIVVEAVVENPKIKSSVLKELEEKVSPNTILTSNTSTIPITDLASGLSRPENFCGMHFFNPVHKMPLVEIIRGKHTSEETIATVVAFAAHMGKSPIVVNDCPGFFVNRVLFPYFLAFCQLLDEGYDFSHIDKIMEKDFGWPMGPAYLLDVVGIDIAYHAQQVICQAYPERMKASPDNIITRLYEAKRFGQKTGEGFYQYYTDKRGKSKKVLSPDINQLVYSSGEPQPVTDSQMIMDRMMVPMMNEVILCMEENIIFSPAEADIALVYGLGFPPFRGGVCRYLDTIGIPQYIQTAQSYQSLGELYRVPKSLEEMAREEKVFYPIHHVKSESERG
ncbi:fatty acid oxidation complex subunit alpha FadB [Vibrio mangrovi]|uniref:enoyl-CoA hydratase n=1 Tax=Vibrio mangrovi TaxID=474394 RepID=A0A1Y6IYD2_9VIBR|nr:fatty acid oxidation complex subunit alpha FadB [Vibrio mangrovi]MDW6002434.1 fatty acid oxidation complex subunit alpha FadB [Vibrio mangrovi]SMS02669.1 Fatty acid oxidation complex subunit alpha [Vibrio mangrovi]